LTWRPRSDATPSLSFTDATPTDIYTLSLHDALPICIGQYALHIDIEDPVLCTMRFIYQYKNIGTICLCMCQIFNGSIKLVDNRRSEEHTSELQSRENLVCRLLLEKKNQEPTSSRTPT